MSEHAQPSKHLPKDGVRIVYHAENRTFARIFNGAFTSHHARERNALNPLLHVERSLEEVKDVVRRKLGLGRDTDVSLKQMAPDGLLDLEDGQCQKKKKKSIG